uniref:Nudix (nucleoside diphosphate linked moiety X)-type motif 17 n=1 Tax=Sinocyclocheilus rhinocerous TaxID=307959 RepID=A0A673IVF0_9TELE
MEKVRKNLVHLSKENAAPQCARFVQSITGHFVGSVEDQATVSCSLANRLCDGGCFLLLGRHFAPSNTRLTQRQTPSPRITLNRGVDVGVAVLLQSANQRLLLSPLQPPDLPQCLGGHVELDEELLDAGLRELKEETGLKLSPDEISSQLLGLWESVYPPMLSRGLPKRHHIVMSTQSHLQLQTCLYPDPAEDSACVWVDACIKSIVLSVCFLHVVSVTEVSPHGELIETLLPVSVFCNRAPDPGEDIERISTGTKFALELWLKTLEPHADMG